jgi:hypothetical protein
MKLSINAACASRIRLLFLGIQWSRTLCIGVHGIETTRLALIENIPAVKVDNLTNPELPGLLLSLCKVNEKDKKSLN